MRRKTFFLGDAGQRGQFRRGERSEKSAGCKRDHALTLEKSGAHGKGFAFCHRKLDVGPRKN